jgi:CheY-like chemotaxis protein
MSTVLPSALVIDDNWDNRNIFTISLEAAGYQITQAEDGISAVALLQTNKYQLIILDLQMPKMDGRAVLQKIRHDPQHQKALVIVVTANPHMATDEVDIEADYVLYKPISVASFTALTRRLKQPQTFESGPKAVDS